jgi:hypothetical protein
MLHAETWEGFARLTRHMDRMIRIMYAQAPVSIQSRRDKSSKFQGMHRPRNNVQGHVGRVGDGLTGINIAPAYDKSRMADEYLHLKSILGKC